MYPSCTSQIHNVQTNNNGVQGSHFSGLTKFPDFSSIFFQISSIFLVFCFLYWKPDFFSKQYTVHLNITKIIYKNIK